MTEKRTFRYSYRAVLMYFALFVAMVLLNFTMKNFEPFSLPLFAAALICGLNPLPLTGMYILAGGLSFITGSGMPFLLFCLQGILLGGTFFVYNRLQKSMRAEFALLILLASAPAVWVYGAYFYQDYLRSTLVASAIFLLCFLFAGALRCLFFHAGRRKLSAEELVYCAAAVAAIGIGLYNCAGSYAYESIALFALLLACALLRNANAMLCALVLGIAPAVCQSAASLSVQPLFPAAFCAYTALSLLFLRAGKLPASLAVFFADILLRYLTEFSNRGIDAFTGSAFYLAMLVPFLPCFLFAVLPETLLARLSAQLKKYGEKRLTRASIDKNRAEVGDRLFEISAAFREIESAFAALDGDTRDDNRTQELILQQIRREVCATCEKNTACSQKTDKDLEKLVAIGQSKGKANLIDIPASLTGDCVNPSGLLFSLNRALTELRRSLLEEENAASGRALFAEQAHALADMLKKLAVAQSAPTGVHADSERALVRALARAGIGCDEVMVLGDLPDIYLTVSGNFTQNRICRAATLALGIPLSLVMKRKIAEDKAVYLLHPTPRFDAAFGLASRVKQGEQACGDTSSIQRIDERRFLCALADGMGSGTYARRVSDCALTLIESLYRAGMAGETVLSTVNRLLAFNREESFACVDIATIDLDTGRADIVKIGSPLAFLLSQSNVEMLESESLPLGILDGIHPTTLTRTLNDGDVLVFFSDGITAAFGSSADLSDFLCRQPAANPQTLADKLLTEACNRAGCVQDDMTVLAVRLFQRPASDPAEQNG